MSYRSMRTRRPGPFGQMTAEAKKNVQMPLQMPCLRSSVRSRPGTGAVLLFPPTTSRP